ncbi:hypothetical protein GF354_00635 [Candidatus Peregrinibacteria bacterium]|nr:hypothetical protein [Candidatus Peregrinibacteria bacterium]
MGDGPEKLSTSEQVAYYAGYAPSKVYHFMERQFLTLVWDDDIPDRFDDIEPELSHEYFGKLIERYSEKLDENEQKMENYRSYKTQIEDYVNEITELYKERKEWHETLGMEVTDAFGKPKLAKYILITFNGEKMTASKALDIIELKLSEHQDYKAYLQEQLARSFFWYRRYLPDEWVSELDDVIIEKFKAQKEQLKAGQYMEFFGIE